MRGCCRSRLEETPGCTDRPGPRPQEAEPPGGDLRVGDAAPAAARQGLCALRDPFLQEMQEPAQPPGLRGALHSGAPRFG